MNLYSTLILIFIGLVSLISYRGFKDVSFRNKYKFDVDAVLVRKEYIRLISSGFLHSGWIHLIMNMMTLYVFAEALLLSLGVGQCLIIYFGSLLGGNILALLIHKEHEYSSLGASGAVCGIVFASVAVFPGMEISLVILPIFVKSWIFAAIFIAVSFYGIKFNNDNIGHEAHLGGALCGMLIAIGLRPDVILTNYLPIAIILIPSVVLFFVMMYKPHILLLGVNENKKYYNQDHQYNELKADKEKELNRILDKIGRKGIDSLTVYERKMLDEYSK